MPDKMVMIEKKIDTGLANLQSALSRIIAGADDCLPLSKVLGMSSKQTRVSYEEIVSQIGDSPEEILMICWQWRLLIPVRTQRCHEWDDRILTATPGEMYEMPNIAKFLVKNAMLTGIWNSTIAIMDFFEAAGEPQWEQMPVLVNRLKEGCPAVGINARQINVACQETGFAGRTDSVIAILKGAGIISPKLGSLAQITRTQMPLYEINPCV